MIPIRDVNPTRTAPVVNTALIIVNVLLFFWEVSLGPRLPETIQTMALVPARFWVTGYWTQDWFSILFSMFLHGGWLHLGGNMLYLWIFGDNVEDRLGHFRYLAFYLLCGAFASFAHAFTNPSSAIPSVGASGAIAGVLGAYLVLFPHARVLTIIPLGFYMSMQEIPALFVLGLWFVIQFFTGIASLGATAQDVGGVAWFAHIGGFVAGLALVFVFGGTRQRRRAEPRRDWR